VILPRRKFRVISIICQTYHIHPPNKNHGWATGADYLLKTASAGLSWMTPVEFYTMTDSAFIKSSGYINTIHFNDTLNRFGIGRNGHIIRTRDGGASWKLVSRISQWPEGIGFADQAHGVIVGEGGAVLASGDSGATWSLSYPRRESGQIIPWFRNVVFLSMNNGWLAGDSGIIMKGRFYTPPTGALLLQHSPKSNDLPKIIVRNRTTLTVYFDLRESGTVFIDFIDVRGRIAASLPAKPEYDGTRVVRFPVNQTLPCGAYYVTLRGKSHGAYAKTVVVR
jgi:hypothetical protein